MINTRIIHQKPVTSPSFGRILLTTSAVVVWLLALALLAGVLAYQYAYQGRVFEGVSVRGIDMSGATLAETEARLRAAFEPFPLAPVTVRYNDESWTLTAKELGVQLDARGAAEAAYLVGRGRAEGDGLLRRAGQFQSNLQQQITAYLSGYEVQAIETVDPAAGLNWLYQQERAINRPVVEASLRLDGLDVSTTGSQTGYQLDVAESQRLIYAALLANRGEPVDLVVRESRPYLAEVAGAERRVRRVLSGPLTLTSPEPNPDIDEPPPSFVIEPEQLALLLALETLPQPDETLVLTASLNVEPLRPLVQGWAAEQAREPRDARLDFDPRLGTVSVATPSQIGQALNVDATLNAIRQAALSETRQAALPLRLVEPAVNMHRIDEMGIVELVAEGTTYFKGSSADRIHNIATATAAVQGITIPPDGIFSFNEAIGDVDEEHGYAESLIIWGDRTAVGIGGGVCQVSTTVFRAAYFAGLPIEERWNHGYVVSWYGQPGLDATIYTPTVDFKFRNTTGHHLLIEAELDEAKGVLTFKLYGTKPDWQVEVIGPETLDTTPAGKPVYQEDESLRRGQIKQVEWAREGMEVAWRRVISDAGGQVLADERLESSYTPWSAYYLVGPGTAVPSGVDFRPLSDAG